MTRTAPQPRHVALVYSKRSKRRFCHKPIHRIDVSGNIGPYGDRCDRRVVCLECWNCDEHCRCIPHV